MNDYCNEHSEHCTRLKALERSVDDLWRKWDRIQMLLVGTLSALCLNLIGMLAILMKIYG